MASDTALLDNALLPFYSTAVADLVAATSMTTAASANSAISSPLSSVNAAGLGLNLQPLLNGAALIYQHYPCLIHPHLLAAAAAAAAATTTAASSMCSSPTTSTNTMTSSALASSLPLAPYNHDTAIHSFVPLNVHNPKFGSNKANRPDQHILNTSAASYATSNSSSSSCTTVNRIAHHNNVGSSMSLTQSGTTNGTVCMKFGSIYPSNVRRQLVEVGTQTVELPPELASNTFPVDDSTSPASGEVCESSLSSNSPDSSIIADELFSVDENNSSLIDDPSNGPLGPKVSEIRESDTECHSSRENGPRSNSERLLSSPSLTYNDVNNAKIWQFYIENKQTEDTYIRKIQLRNALHVMFAKYYTNCGLHIVGSSINSFGTEQSDMDLCLTISTKDLQSKKDAKHVLEQLLNNIGQCSYIKDGYIINARIPILKFRDSLSGVDCDVNMNNVVGIYNTHLMAYYSRIDWRVKPLVMFVKAWAQANDIHDASKGRLSTYCYILLVIQYLQAGCHPHILPCLQQRFPVLFTYDRPIREIDLRPQLPWDELRSQNTMSLFELFEGFLEYYNDFDFRQQAVSVRQGRPLPLDIALKQMPPYEQLLTMRNFYMYVEEPFSRANVARSLFGESVYFKIRQCFRNSYNALRQKKDLSLLINCKKSH